MTPRLQSLKDSTDLRINKVTEPFMVKSALTRGQETLHLLNGVVDSVDDRRGKVHGNTILINTLNPYWKLSHSNSSRKELIFYQFKEFLNYKQVLDFKLRFHCTTSIS